MKISINLQKVKRGKIFIVFIGPQGAGKTTLARLLTRKLMCKGFRMCNIRLIDYTIYHYIYLKVLISIAKNVDFAEVFSRLLLLFIILHFIGSSISILKFALLRFIWRCEVIIEDEGFIFKEIADIYFTLGITNSLRAGANQHIVRSFLKYLFSIGRKSMKNTILIYVNAPYSILKMRYERNRKKVEDRRYVAFQDSIYKLLLNHANVICEDMYQGLRVDNISTASALKVVKHITRIVERLRGARYASLGR
jgi:DNA polymerase III delta prime subunit